MNADEIKVESDERGFELHVYAEFTDAEIRRAEETGLFVINVHHVAVDLYNEVVKEIGPWIVEMLDAKREYDTGVADDPAQQPVLNRIKGVYDQENEVETFLEAADLARKRMKEDR